MSEQALVKSAREYIFRSRELASLRPGDSRRDQVRADLESTSLALEDALDLYEDRRSRASRFRTFLVAVDRSEPALWAVAEAVRLAEPLGARVYLVHVVDPAVSSSVELAFDEPGRVPALIDAAQKLLDSFVERVPKDLAGQKLVREGRATVEIVEAAKEIAADLIVMGTHGRGAIGRVLLGSVAEAVVREAQCPVLTVAHSRQEHLPKPYAMPTGAQAARTN